MSAKIGPEGGEAPLFQGPSPTGPGIVTGVWMLKGTRPVGKPGADSPCYPKHTLALAADSAVGTGQYVNAGGNPNWGKVTSGSATGRITWNPLPPALRPGERFVLNFRISLEHTFVPLSLPCSFDVYFNSPPSVGGGSITHSGDNPAGKNDKSFKLELPPMPSGQLRQKFTIWINVNTPGGMGDYFFDYEFR